MISQRLLNMGSHYVSENGGRMPNVLQQVFADISNAPCDTDLQREIEVVDIEVPGSQYPATEGANAFRCMQCGKVYTSKGNLTRHLKFECGKEPQFQCPHCTVRTKHKSSLLTHICCKHSRN
jgi:DNA-directed RNA polymerase subunit RPC12/RpoP